MVLNFGSKEKVGSTHDERGNGCILSLVLWYHQPYYQTLDLITRLGIWLSG